MNIDTVMLKTQLDLLEWLLLHPGAREAEGAPGWVYKADPPEETGGPHWKLHVFNRVDGRGFDFYVGLWTRTTTMDSTPMAVTFDWSVRKELHERYPDDYPEHPPVPPSSYVSDWPPAMHLNAAFDALVNKDMASYDERLKDAGVAMGVFTRDEEGDE